MTRPIARLFLALALTLTASAAFGQSAPPTVLNRGYVSVNALYQGTTSTFATSWSSPVYQETESVTAGYSVKPGVVFDAGAGVRVWSNLVVGAAFSRYQRADFASLSASVPHPFLFNQPRTVTDTAAGPSRTETAVHGHAMWMFAAGSRVQVGVFGGPSVFSVQQVSIATVKFADVYPYTSVTVGSTTTGSETKSKVGFNVGGDVTVLLARQVGVGVLVRYAGVNVGLTAPDGSSLSVKAGGLQVGAGLRIHF